ncbi:MAG: EAL domain-containing protein, partial [Gemmatimonadaceae bacterium]|nr:EAL domain-containing protein [Gemmatimonadaceae bacterium]
ASVSREGAWYWDVRRGVVHVSPRTSEMLGAARADAARPARDVLRFLNAADLPLVRRTMRQLASGHRSRADIECRLLTPGGETRWMLLRARALAGAGGTAHYVAGVILDIDARRQSEDRLRHEARHDPLTGLPNRAAFTDALYARIARAVAGEQPFAVAYLDLDRFKLVNDTLGHGCGDSLLSAAAARLQGCLGAGDVLARMGGDEFVALIDRAADAERVVGEMQRTMRAPLVAEGRSIFTSVSIGVRLCHADRCRPSELVRDADLAMYEAKRAGGARSVTFARALHDAVLRRFTIHHELQAALHGEQFRLAYHPIFDTAEHRLCGFEARLRWAHPERGMLAAVEFIDDANESGVIVPIGRWVVREVCAQLADWNGAYPQGVRVSVGVNLCDRELLDPEFVTSIEDALSTSGVEPSQLRLEMTEGAVAAHFTAIKPVLERLHSLGVRLQLDDFGAGRTSIGMLPRLPLSAVKLDRGVVGAMAGCNETQALVATILSFANRLGLEVIADGVDSDEQVALLASLGECRYVQGRVAERVGV